MERIYGLVIALLLLAGNVHGQSQIGTLGPFAGLNDSANAVSIGENEAQAALNVRLTKDGNGLRSRSGFSLDATMTVATAPITGSHFFKNAGGSLVRLYMHDRYVSASVDGGAFANLVTTAASTTRSWDCAESQGVAYCLSNLNNQLFGTSGLTVTWYPTLPAGTQIEFSPSRMIIAGTAANPNRINFSAAGSFTDFTAGTNDSSAFTQDVGVAGDKVTAIKYAIGRLIIWQNQAMSACEGTNQFNLICYDISKVVGTEEPQSIINYNGTVFFRGQDNHFYSYDGSSLTKISRKIQTFVSGLVAGSNRSNTQTEQADFNLGTQSPTNSWSSTSTLGSIEPSTWAYYADTAANFGAGTLINFSTTYSDGDLYFKYMRDSFVDGDYTSAPTWLPVCVAGNGATRGSAVISGGALSINGGQITAGITFTQNCTLYTAATGAYGTWSFDILESTISASTATVGFISDGQSGSGYGLAFSSTSGSTFNIALVTVSALTGCAGGSACTVLVSSSLVSTNGASHWYKINRKETGAFEIFRDSINIINATDNTMASGGFFSVSVKGMTGRLVIDNIVTPSTASYKTPEQSITFSTRPIYGNLSISSTVTSASTLRLESRMADSSGGPQDVQRQIYDGTQISTTPKLFLTFIASASASAVDSPVTISSFTLPAATTGQFYGQCVSGAGTVTAFGTISFALTQSTGGSLALFTRSGASCPLSSAWQAQSNNAAVAATLNQAFQWRADSSLANGSDTNRIDDVTMRWTEAQPSATFGTYFDDDLYWTVTYSSGLKSNRILYLDLLHGQFFPWDIPATAPMDAAGTLYFGSSRSGYVYKFGEVENDTGTAISSYWTSKELALGDISRTKSLSTLSLVMKPQSAGSLSLDYVVNGTSTTTRSVSMVSTKPVVVSNFNAATGTSGSVLRFRIYSTAINNPWEVYAIKYDYTFLPWQTQ